MHDTNMRKRDPEIPKLQVQTSHHKQSAQEAQAGNGGAGANPDGVSVMYFQDTLRPFHLLTYPIAVRYDLEMSRWLTSFWHQKLSSAHESIT